MSLIDIINDLGEKQFYKIVESRNQSQHTIGTLLLKGTKKIKGFINMVENENKKESKEKQHILIEDNKYNLEPMISFSNDYIITIVITGPKGVGKSAMGFIFHEQYKKFLPRNKTYLISQKLKKYDKNYKKTDIHQMTEEEIKEFDLDNYKNSLFIIDDADFGDNNKYVYKLCNQVSTIGRDLGISFILISHINSNLTQNKAYQEADMYLCYPVSLSDNNRMLTGNMNFNKKQIDEFKALKAKYYVFYREFNTLLTNKIVIKY